MTNRVLIAQKLAQIAACCDELVPVAAVPLQEFRSRPAHFRLAERDVQLVVDSAVDVNNQIILEAGGAPPQKYFDAFLEMGRRGVIPPALARRLARTTGLRNRIVHAYESVDLRIVHRVLPRLIADFREFARRLRARR